MIRTGPQRNCSKALRWALPLYACLGWVRPIESVRPRQDEGLTPPPHPPSTPAHQLSLGGDEMWGAGGCRPLVTPTLIILFCLLSR